jgi:hypothetical protein
MSAQEIESMNAQLTGKTAGSDWDIEANAILDSPEKREVTTFGSLNALPFIPARTLRGEWKEGGRKVEMADFRGRGESVVSSGNKKMSTVSLSSYYGSGDNNGS